MSHVYQHAVCIIAATASTGANSGLSAPMDYEADVHVHEVHFARQLPTLEEELESSEWDKRGWIMQEHYLSRRILHYGRHQVFFECHAGCLDERGRPVIDTQKTGGKLREA